MIDAIGMHEVNRWLAIAQLDGWGEEYRLLAIGAARALGCQIGELMPYEDAVHEHETQPADVTLTKLSALAGF